MIVNYSEYNILLTGIIYYTCTQFLGPEYYCILLIYPVMCNIALSLIIDCIPRLKYSKIQLNYTN